MTGWLPRSPLLQTAIVTAGLGVLAALVYGSYIAKGGFVTDPWVVMAWYEFAPDKGPIAFSQFYIENNGLGIVRSLDFIRLALQSVVLGSNMTLWLAWQVTMAVIMSAALFLLLRKLGLAFVHAAAIAALVLIFPAASSIKIWPIMGSPASITLAALGFVVALRAFEKKGRMQFALHGGSLMLFVASAFLYESTLFVMLLSVFVYRIRVPWQQAIRRWIVDLLVLGVVAMVLTAKGSARGQQDIAGTISHAGTMADQALTLLTTVVLPLGAIDRWIVVSVLALIPVTAILMLRRESSPEQATVLRTWLVVLAAGLVVIVAGYAAYVSADNYYEPMSPGIGNRVNAVPSAGFVLVLYGLAMLVAAMALRRSSSSRVLIPGAGLLVCLVVGISWLQPLSRDKEAFILAHKEVERVTRAVQATVPDPPSYSTIWTLGHPFEVAPGIPIFDRWGNLTSRVRLAYGDPTLNGLLGAPGTWFSCGPKEIVPHGAFYDEPSFLDSRLTASRYGRTYFVDTGSKQPRAKLIRTPRECEVAAKKIPRSPYLPGETPPPVPSPLSAVDSYRLNPDGTNLVGPDGKQIPVRPGASEGYVDNVVVVGSSISVTGWAAAGTLVAPADQVVAVSGGVGVAGITPAEARPDLVEAYGEPAIEHSGFTFLVERSALDCTEAPGLTVFGVAEAGASSLTMVGNSESELAAACRAP